MIDQVVTHPWVIGLLAFAFVFSMIGFWLRIRRDDAKRAQRLLKNQ